MTEEQKNIMSEFNKMVRNWFDNLHLSCETCANRTDNSKDKCKLKCYCIVKDYHGICGYEPKIQFTK